MSIIISIANQKGGVGKTTTCQNLAAVYGIEYNKQTLVLDMDPQGGLTTLCGHIPDDIEQTIYQVLLKQLSLNDILLATNMENVHLIPANLDLSGAEFELPKKAFWPVILSRALAPIKSQYDIILIDCPPSLGVLTINAIVACQLVLSPLQCQYLPLRAIPLLKKILFDLQEEIEREIPLFIVRTMYNRTNQSKQASQEIKRAMGEDVANIIIKSATKIADAGSPPHHQSIVQYASNSNGAGSYRELAKEVLNHVNSI